MYRRIAAQLLTILWLAVRADAQATPPADTVKRVASGWMNGFLLGVPGSGSGAIPELFTVGASFTRVHPNHLGGDVSIGTMPYVAAFGVVPIGVRVGLSLP